MPRHRVAIFVDGPNFYWSTKKQNIRFDFTRFLTGLLNQGVEIAIMKMFLDDFSASNVDNDDFCNIMESVGFDVIKVPPKIYHRKGREKGKFFKSRTDNWITCEAMEHLLYDEFDVFILFSGDSDFERLLEKIKEYGKEIIIVASQENLAEDLKKYGQILLYEELLDTEMVLPIKAKSAKSVA